MAQQTGNLLINWGEMNSVLDMLSLRCLLELGDIKLVPDVWVCSPGVVWAEDICLGIIMFYKTGFRV